MALKTFKPVPVRLCVAVICVFCAIGAVGEQSSSMDVGSSGHHVVLLLDVNPHQSKVLAVELALAEGIIEKCR